MTSKIELYCSECGGELDFHEDEEGIHVDLCVGCTEAIKTDYYYKGIGDG